MTVAMGPWLELDWERRHPRATEFTTVGRTYQYQTSAAPLRLHAGSSVPPSCVWLAMPWHVTGLLLRRGHARRPHLHASSSAATPMMILICCVVVDGLRADFTFSDEGMRRAVAQCRVAGCCRLRRSRVLAWAWQVP